MWRASRTSTTPPSTPMATVTTLTTAQIGSNARCSMVDSIRNESGDHARYWPGECHRTRQGALILAQALQPEAPERMIPSSMTKSRWDQWHENEESDARNDEQDLALDRRGRCVTPTELPDPKGGE